MRGKAAGRILFIFMAAALFFTAVDGRAYAAEADVDMPEDVIGGVPEEPDLLLPEPEAEAEDGEAVLAAEDSPVSEDPEENADVFSIESADSAPALLGAGEEVTDDYFIYTTSDKMVIKGLTVAGKAATELVVPEGVQCIGESPYINAFKECAAETISLPSSLTTIRGNSFKNAENLTSICLPSGLTTIEEFAFNGCKALQQVQIDTKGLTTVGQNIFKGCALNKIIFLEGITEIPENLFYGATFAEGFQLTIPASVTRIGKRAFESSTGLARVSFEVGSRLTVIKESAFLKSKLTTIELPEGLETIEREAFRESSLTAVTLPRSLKEIYENTFYSCTNLKDVKIRSVELSFLGVIGADFGTFGNCAISGLTLSDEMTYIPAYLFKAAAFADCSVTIPAAVKTIGIRAFEGARGIDSIAFAEDSQLQTIKENAFSGCKTFTSLELPQSLKTIEAGAFSAGVTNGTSLISVTFAGDAELETIGERAFFYVALTNIALPQGLKEIGERAFYGTGLDGIELPQSLEKIGAGAFGGNKALMTVRVCCDKADVPRNESVFADCGKIHKVVFDNDLAAIPANLFYMADFDEGGIEVIIPAAVRTIGSYAFAGSQYHQVKLKGVTFEENSQLESIGEKAFAYTLLDSIALPDSLRILEGEIFTGTDLTTLELPVSLREIGDNAFKGMQFSTVVLPENLTRIGEDAFSGNTSLTEITLPESLEEIGAGAFSGCSKLHYVMIGSDQIWVDPSKISHAGVFSGCVIDTLLFSSRVSALPNGLLYGAGFQAEAEIVLPTTITSIGKGNFSMCSTQPRGITIPASVTMIDDVGPHREGNEGDIWGVPFSNYSDRIQFHVVEGSYAYKWLVENWGYSDGDGHLVIARRIIYVLNDGVNSPQNPETYGTGERITLYAPTRAGYTFAGWYLTRNFSGTGYIPDEKTGTVALDTKGIVKLTLYAKWTANYLIFFDANGGDNGTLAKGDNELLGLTAEGGKIAGIDVSGLSRENGFLQAMQYGEEVTLDGQEYERRGYTLSGWKSSKTNKVVKNGVLKNLTTVPEVITYTAQWTKNTYKVTYAMNGGSYVSGAEKGITSYTAETRETLLPGAKDLQKKGYAFAGWYDNKALEGAAITAVGGDNVLRTLSLFAKWEPIRYTITLNKNAADAVGGTDAAGAAVTDGAGIEVEYDTTYTLSKTAFTRGGYTLSSWNTQSDGKGKKYAVTAKLKNLQTEGGEGIALYAQWTANTYKITYALDGGKQSGAPANYKPGVGAGLKVPIRTGYTFAGWSLAMKNRDAATTAALDESRGAGSVTAASYGDIVLTAAWTENRYKVRYYLNRAEDVADGAAAVPGVGSDADKGLYVEESYDYEETIGLNAPAKKLEALLAAGAGMPSISAFTVKPDGKGTGYALNKSFAKLKSGSGDVLEVFAKWGDKTYFLTYELNGSTLRNAPNTYAEKAGVTISVPSKAGYVFTGWAAKHTDSGVALSDAQISVNAKTNALTLVKGTTGDVTLTANFRPVNYYVTLNPNAKDAKLASGDTAATGKLKSGEAYSFETEETVDALNRTGYTFRGYNLKSTGKGAWLEETSEGSGKYRLAGLGSADKGNVTIYAVWAANTYQVAYLDGVTGNAIDQTPVTNRNPASGVYAKAIKLVNPARKGYAFAGWKLNELTNNAGGVSVLTTTKNGAEYVTQVRADNTADLSLRADFIENSYKVRISSNGGVHDESRKKEVLQLPESRRYTESFDISGYEKRYSRNGYVFIGFALDAAGKKPIGDTKAVSMLSDKNNATVTVYATWEKVATVKPSDVTAEGQAGKITLSYTGSGKSDARYEVQYATSLNFRNAGTKTQEGSSIEIDGLLSGQNYFLRVREIRTDSQGNAVTGAWSRVVRAKTATDG